MSATLKMAGWGVIALLGASALGMIALQHNETINAAWLVVAAVCSYFVAYRFYAQFIAKTVFKIGRAHV